MRESFYLHCIIDKAGLDFNAGAQSARRQSLAKLNNLPLEAPITKVISLITKAQENSNENVSQVLDKVSAIGISSAKIGLSPGLRTRTTKYFSRGLGLAKSRDKQRTSYILCNIKLCTPLYTNIYARRRNRVVLFMRPANLHFSVE